VNEVRLKYKNGLHFRERREAKREKITAIGSPTLSQNGAALYLNPGETSTASESTGS